MQIRRWFKHIFEPEVSLPSLAPSRGESIFQHTTWQNILCGFFPSLDWVKLFLDWKIIKWYSFPWNLIFYKIHRSPQEHLEDLFVYCQGGLYQYSRNINNMTRNMNVKSVKTLQKRYASWSYFPCRPLYPYSASVTSGIFWTPWEDWNTI